MQSLWHLEGLLQQACVCLCKARSIGRQDAALFLPIAAVYQPGHRQGDWSGGTSDDADFRTSDDADFSKLVWDCVCIGVKLDLMNMVDIVG